MNKSATKVSKVLMFKDISSKEGKNSVKSRASHQFLDALFRKAEPKGKIAVNRSHQVGNVEGHFSTFDKFIKTINKN